MATKRIAIGAAVAFAAALLLAPPASAGMRDAKKEGKITWYSSLGLPVAQAVCNLYNKKNTGITCELHRSGSGKLYRRYLQEAKGRVYRADVLHTSNIGHFFKLRGKKYFIKYKPKGVDSFDAAFINKHRFWTILRAFTITPAYNTKKVKKKNVPTSWRDFLHPRWRKRLAHGNPSYSGGITVSMIPMVKMFGWGYYKQLAALKPRIIGSAAAVPGLVARGEAHLAVGTASYTTYSLIKKGEPLKMFIPKEGVAFVVSPNSILRKAPHPNAAVVFTDFLFTKEVQQLLADKGLYVGHPDVTYPKAIPRLGSFKRLIVDPADVKKHTKGMRKGFRKRFGV